MIGIRPMRGQCLIEMLPPDSRTSGGIELPEVVVNPPETDHGRHKRVEPRGVPLFGRVLAIGPWAEVKKGNKKGYLRPPDFGIGAKVIVSSAAGQKLQRNLFEQYKLVEQRRVLAVIEDATRTSTPL